MTNLSDDGVRIFINLCNLKKAIASNPQGIVATASMNNLYIETATELVTVYTTLKDAQRTDYGAIDASENQGGKHHYGYHKHV